MSYTRKRMSQFTPMGCMNIYGIRKNVRFIESEVSEVSSTTKITLKQFLGSRSPLSTSFLGVSYISVRHRWARAFLLSQYLHSRCPKISVAFRTVAIVR